MNEFCNFRTDFLFSKPSFLVGAGCIFNIAGNYFDYNISRTGLQADLKALKSDWSVVGQDIGDAQKKFKKQFVPDQLNFNFDV